jgi:hypothetical protein
MRTKFQKTTEKHIMGISGICTYHKKISVFKVRSEPRSTHEGHVEILKESYLTTY